MGKINKYRLLILTDLFIALLIVGIVTTNNLIFNPGYDYNDKPGSVLGDFESCSMNTTYISRSNCTSNFGDLFPVDVDYMGCGNAPGHWCPRDSDTEEETDGDPSAPPDSYIRDDCDARNFVDLKCITRDGRTIRSNGKYSIDSFSFDSASDDYVTTLSASTTTTLGSVDLVLDIFYGDDSMGPTCQTLPSADPGYGVFETITVSVPVGGSVDVHFPQTVNVPDSYFENGCVGIRTDIAGYNGMKEDCAGGWTIPGSSYEDGPAVLSNVVCSYATTPTPTASNTPTVTPTSNPTVTPIDTGTPTPSNTLAPTNSPIPSNTPTLSPTPTAGSQPQLTATPTPLVGSVLPDTGSTVATVYFISFMLLLIITGFVLV